MDYSAVQAYVNRYRLRGLKHLANELLFQFA